MATVPEIHAVETWAPYTVYPSDDQPEVDCHNVSTAKYIASTYDSAKIFDNDLGVFIDQHPVFGLKVKVQS
jgi:hypothetical protein